jgi:hypothetical protein
VFVLANPSHEVLEAMNRLEVNADYRAVKAWIQECSNDALLYLRDGEECETKLAQTRVAAQVLDQIVDAMETAEKYCDKKRNT